MEVKLISKCILISQIGYQQPYSYKPEYYAICRGVFGLVNDTAVVTSRYFSNKLFYIDTTMLHVSTFWSEPRTESQTGIVFNLH